MVRIHFLRSLDYPFIAINPGSILTEEAVSYYCVQTNDNY